MKNKFSKFSISIRAEGRVAAIKITDAITNTGDNSATSIRQQVDNALNIGISSVEVYVNSRGGDCFEATEIANQLDRFGNSNVKLKVGAIAASAVTYLTSKFYTIANANSQFMIHRPSLGTYGNVAGIEADLKLLKITTADYKTVYAKKTGKSEIEIEALWGTGDFWMTANEALKNGFIDSIAQDEQSAPVLSAIAIATANNAHAGWSFEDYQDKAPKELETLHRTNPAAFKSLAGIPRQSYTGSGLVPTPTAMDIHKGWSFDDYQDRDPKALERIAHHIPALFEHLFKLSYPSN